MSNRGMHHFHVRKRIYRKHEPYPHPDKWKRFLDKSIYFVAMFGPVMTIPQILRIWVSRDAAGVSVISWASFMAAAVFWLMYGISHNAKPIIVTNVLWLIFEAAIVAGAIIY